MKNKKFYMHKIANLLVINKIITIHYQELNENYIFEGESHNFWEIIYTDKNEIICTIEDQKTSLKQGEILFISPMRFHTVYGNGKDNANICVITFECKSEVMSYFHNKHFTLNENSKALLATIITEAKNVFDLPEFDPNLNKLVVKNNKNLGGEQVIKNSLELLLINLIREETIKPTSNLIFISKLDDDNIVDVIIKHLNKKIYSTVTLDELCNLTNYGKTYLCMTFKQNTKTTIISYYISLKIKEAKKLIKKNEPFTVISEKLCFDSLPHFTATFKKYTNMTPRQYKNSILS